MSTMKIMTPKGVIREIDKVVPVVEKRIEFNDESRRLVERAKDMSVQPTALALHYADNTAFGCESELFVGNLSPQKVTEIQQSLVKDGFFDFSGLKYQKADRLDKTVFDEGASNAYTSEHIFGLMGNYTGSLYGLGFDNMNCRPTPLCNGIFAQDDIDYDEEGDDCCDDDEEEGED